MDQRAAATASVTAATRTCDLPAVPRIAADHSPEPYELLMQPKGCRKGKRRIVSAKVWGQLRRQSTEPVHRATRHDPTT
jgi:hypothetical protein